MKSLAFLPAAAVALLAQLLLAPAASADEKFTAQTFAGNDGKLDTNEAAMYVIYRDGISVASLLKPGQLTLDPAKLAQTVGIRDALSDLRSKTGHTAPWTVAELDTAFPAKPTDAEAAAAMPAWKKVVGLTKVKELGKDGENGSLGPIRLRKTPDDLVKGLADSKGISVGYSNDRLAGTGGLWNSQGAIDYPIKLIRQTGPGGSTELELGPEVDWNIAQSGKAGDHGTEELNFALPLTAYIVPGGERMTGTYEENIRAVSGRGPGSLWILQARPYYQTDFSGGHEIFGSTASLEFVGDFAGLAIGGFQDIGSSGLQYQIRLIPKVNYSSTEREGVHTTRKAGDDWFRVGGKASFDLRLGAASFNPLDLGVAYEGMSTVSGNGDYGDLLEAHATWWLSENAGVTLKYTKGDTPVAEKKVDMLTLGFEFKY